ncbi:disease resistance protein RPM1-like [Prunus avium]|uniref:Disease resistance protein RPM1-like n=1 Tax=Prunus avium TaxID=42229 RepID=A0A6P5TU71_PRUAV|nr:disease resistance protein RPM1-like [Prunus avium]
MAIPTDFLIGKIVTILEKEASSIGGVRDEIDDIKQELVSMTAFLNDAEGKNVRSEGGRMWVASVRGMAYDVEDIIDEFMYHMYEQGCHKGRVARWLHQTIRIPQNVWFRRQMSKKLRKISRMIKAIPERNQRYSVGGLEGTSSTCDDVGKGMRNQAESSLFIKEDELVGIERKNFDDLPYPLKYCFLYCSLFPEDYLIRRKRLIRLWIAEGFVEDVKGATSEEVAESYLMELIFRSMLHVVLRNESGRPKACKMHDLMRELALSTSEKEKFGAVHDGKEVMDEVQVRRLSTQTTGGEIKLGTGMAQLRTFLVFVTDMSSSSSSNTLPSGFKLLRGNSN